MANESKEIAARDAELTEELLGMSQANAKQAMEHYNKLKQAIHKELARRKNELMALNNEAQK